ncbi:MAG: translation initiation factor eIF-2B [Candidatus Helarchaeota archaeon]
MPVDEKVKKLIKKISKNNISGANKLAKQAVEALIMQIKSSSKNLISDLEEIIKLILDAQPSMAPLINGVGFIMNEILEFDGKISVADLKERAIKKGEKFLKDSDLAMKKISMHTNDLIRKNDVILTHSMSQTVINILEYNKSKDLKMILTESRPQCEGISLARTLAKNFSVTLILDSAIGHFIKTNKIDLVLIGADSILADGSIINKIGTYPLALTAYEHQLPFYVATESYKFNPRSYFGKPIIIEEKSPNEILSQNIPGVEVKNFYFDITPSKYITSLITEDGIFTPMQFIRSVIKELPLNWFKKYLNF